MGEARQQRCHGAERRIDYSYTPDNPLIDFKAKLYYVDTRNDQSTLTRGSSKGYEVTYQTNTYGFQAQNMSTFALSELSVIKANYGLEFFYDKVRPDSNQMVASDSAVTASAAESVTPKVIGRWAACSRAWITTMTIG